MRISVLLLLLTVALAGPMSPATGAKTSPRICCLAQTAQCLACAAGKTVAEYCKENPTTAECPKPDEEKTKPEPTMESVCKEINVMYKQHPDATLEDVAEHIEENYDVTLQEAVQFYHECKVEGYESKHYHEVGKGDEKPDPPTSILVGGTPVVSKPSTPPVVPKPSSSGPAAPTTEAKKKVCMTKVTKMKKKMRLFRMRVQLNKVKLRLLRKKKAPKEKRLILRKRIRQNRKMRRQTRKAIRQVKKSCGIPIPKPTSTQLQHRIRMVKLRVVARRLRLKFFQHRKKKPKRQIRLKKRIARGKKRIARMTARLTKLYPAAVNAKPKYTVKQNLRYQRMRKRVVILRQRVIRGLKSKGTGENKPAAGHGIKRGGKPGAGRGNRKIPRRGRHLDRRGNRKIPRKGPRRGRRGPRRGRRGPRRGRRGPRRGRRGPRRGLRGGRRMQPKRL